MYEVELLPTAWGDLKKIQDWYTIQSGPDAATKVTDGILGSLKRLNVFPESGSNLPDKWLNEQGYKMVLSGEYISIYKFTCEKVFVYHIASTKTEYTKLFY